MLLSNLAFSQVGYPRLIVLNKDTVIAITQRQMQLINNSHLSYLEEKEINDSLLVAVDSFQEALALEHYMISSYKEEVTIKDSSVKELEDIVLLQEKVIKQQKKEIRKLKVHKGLLATVDFFLIGVIGYILVVH